MTTATIKSTAAKSAATILMALLCAACDQAPQPSQPPTPKTSEPYTGIYQDQVNALDKAKQTSERLEQSEAERKQALERAAQ